MHRVVAELEAQFAQASRERRGGPNACRVTRFDCFSPTDSGRHDLVGAGVLEHAVLMNAGLMGERVGADDRLVVLHHKAGDGGPAARPW